MLIFIRAEPFIGWKETEVGISRFRQKVTTSKIARIGMNVSIWMDVTSSAHSSPFSSTAKFCLPGRNLYPTPNLIQRKKMRKGGLVLYSGGSSGDLGFSYFPFGIQIISQNHHQYHCHHEISKPQKEK
jgi:hypothetical protein